jgi:hypothetical protein
MMQKDLAPTAVIDCDEHSIIDTAKQLTNEKKNDPEKAKALFFFVRDKIKYNISLPKLTLKDNKASVTLQREAGYCVQKAVLLAALARAIDIPARLHFSDIRNFIVPKPLLEQRGGINLFVYHGYDELYINGRWVKVVVAFDNITCEKNRLIPVNFDGLNNALLPKYNRDGKLHIEYEKNHGHYSDLPLDQIIAERKRIYGIDDLSKW